MEISSSRPYKPSRRLISARPDTACRSLAPMAAYLGPEATEQPEASSPL
jgi:hypothetical protein